MGGDAGLRSVEFEEGVFGELVAEVVVAHVGGEERAAVEIGHGLQVDGVAQAVRKDCRWLPSGSMTDEGGADDFAFVAVVAGAAGGDEEARAAVQRGEGDGAREVPAAVLVVEAVVGEAREGLGRAGGRVVAGVVFVADELVGERKVEPDWWVAGSVQKARLLGLRRWSR